MEQTIIILFPIVFVLLLTLLANTVWKLVSERKELKQSKMLVEVLCAITSHGPVGPSLNTMTKLEIDILKELGYQLSSYYKKLFFTADINKDLVKELYRYIYDLNDQPASPQKDFIGEIIKETIFSQPVNNLTELIYFTIEVKNTTGYEYGSTVMKFLFGDIPYLKFILETKSILIVIAMMKQRTYLPDVKILKPEQKVLVIHDFDETTKLLNNLYV